MIQLQQEESERKVSIPTEKKSKNEMSKTGKVTVVSLIKYAHGHENPLIVIKNERYQHLGTVDFKEKLELGIESECKLRFSTHYLEARCTQCMVRPGDVIYLTHNQTIDCLEPIVLHAGEKSEQIDIIKKNIKNYDIFVHIRRWTLVIACLLCALYPLIDSGVFSSSSASKSNPNDPAYYYGTWSSSNGTIEVSFRNDMTAKCKTVLGHNEPIEWDTKWAVSPDNGVFWGTYYGRGEYSFMTPDGHLYHYVELGDRYTDDEIYLHKK